MSVRISLVSAVSLFAAFLPTALRSEEQGPVIVWQVSEEALNRRTNETIERESAVDDMVLGTHVVGTAKTTGKPRIRLVDSASGPIAKVMFSGATVSHTTGYHFPVVIYSRSQTDFTVEKLVAIEQLGGVYPHPTRIRATTNTFTENITTPRRGLWGKLVLRRAWKEVANNNDKANAIAQQSAEKQIRAAFDEALASRLEKLKQQMSMRNLVAAVLPADAAPAYRTVTKDGYLTIAVFAHAPENKTVEISLPKLPVKDQPVQIWLHKSVAGNYLSAAGNSLDPARLWQALPMLIISNATKELPRSPHWLTVGDWYVVQFTGAEK